MKKLALVVLVVIAGILTYKYWPSIRGIYKANAPVGQNIVEMIDQASDATNAPGQNATGLPLKIPDGYKLSVYAKGLINPRDLVLDSRGTLLVSVPGKQKVLAIVNGEPVTVLGDLNRPHGLAVDGNKLYVAETDKVSVYDYDPNGPSAANRKEIIDLPGGGGHFTRSILVWDNKIYVSVGSSCNVCVEKDPRRAAIWSANLDGSDFKPFATGLRNAVFLTVKPGTEEIWATNMGRDNLGDNIPPETVNIIKQGAHYGWPYCYGRGVTDTEMNEGNKNFDCTKMEFPQIEMQAHSAPLGLAFLGKDLLVAYHGSWNRSVPTGYKVVKFVNGREEDFVTGWYKDGEVWGRPADVLVKGGGSEIFISDDKAGAIYLLTKI